MSMTAFEEVINLPVPPVLYHYTNAMGMMGIVNRAEIWCTHTQYLNDTQEFRHALHLFRNEVRSRILTKSTNHEFLTRVDDLVLTGVESTNVCVASFSTERDSLSQWRAYASAPGGFALGFGGKQLQESIEKYGGTLIQCVYDEKAQLKIVEEIVDHIVEQNDLNIAMTAIWATAPILKHEAFASEREWRLLTSPISVANDRFDVRPGLSMLIPYFKLDLADSSSDLDIHEVIIGPTPNPKQSAHSLLSFLLKHELQPAISNSAAPFRTW